MNNADDSDDRSHAAQGLVAFAAEHPGPGRHPAPTRTARILRVRPSLAMRNQAIRPTMTPPNTWTQPIRKKSKRWFAIRTPARAPVRWLDASDGPGPDGAGAGVSAAAGGAERGFSTCAAAPDREMRIWGAWGAGTGGGRCRRQLLPDVLVGEGA